VKRTVLLVIAFIVAAACARLGVWQLSRLSERREANALLEARLALPVLVLPADSTPDALHFRRAAVRGVFDFAHEVVVTGRSRNGVPGVHVVTPLGLSDGTALLVERGWVASPDARSIDLARVAEPESALVEGLLYEPEGGGPPGDSGWPLVVRSVVPAEMAPRYAKPIHPAVLRRLTDSDLAVPDLWSLELPAINNGPHLSYAVQWFSFGVIALVGSVILVARSRTRS
jgi:surfeit locus 1 family protein